MKNYLTLGILSLFAMSVMSCGMMDGEKKDPKQNCNRKGSRSVVSQVEQVNVEQESVSVSE